MHSAQFYGVRDASGSYKFLRLSHIRLPHPENVFDCIFLLYTYLLWPAVISLPCTFLFPFLINPPFLNPWQTHCLFHTVLTSLFPISLMKCYSQHSTGRFARTSLSFSSVTSRFNKREEHHDQKTLSSQTLFPSGHFEKTKEEVCVALPTLDSMVSASFINST